MTASSRLSPMILKRFLAWMVIRANILRAWHLERLPIIVDFFQITWSAHNDDTFRLHKKLWLHTEKCLSTEEPWNCSFGIKRRGLGSSEIHLGWVSATAVPLHGIRRHLLIYSTVQITFRLRLRANSFVCPVQMSFWSINNRSSCGILSRRQTRVYVLLNWLCQRWLILRDVDAKTTFAFVRKWHQWSQPEERLQSHCSKFTHKLLNHTTLHQGYSSTISPKHQFSNCARENCWCVGTWTKTRQETQHRCLLMLH